MKHYVLISALAFAAFGVTGLHAQSQQQSEGQLQQAPSRAAALPDFTSLMKKQGPAVVNVITAREPSAVAGGGISPDDPMLEFFRRFIPNLPEEGGRARQGLGSGFIISKDGYILTNAHVVAGSDNVTVRLSDAKREFRAKVVGIDKRTDIALIKVEPESELPVATFGKSETLEPGDWVAAIGSPFGFDNTITAGIVSAKGRSLPDETYVPFIQTDVAVNPGNSGGPLLNLDGEVVGVNSMIYSGTGGYMGVSFAIPIEVALDVAKELRETGKVTRGRIGIGIQPVTKDLAQAFNLDEAMGVVIVNVESGGPAAKAGAQPGDVVLAWNGKKIDEVSELPRLVAATEPGKQATMEIWRNGKRHQLKIEVGELAPETIATSKAQPSKGAGNRLGLAVAELPEAQRKTLGVDYGVVVTEVVGPPAHGTPIQAGDVIVAVNQQRFSSVEEFNKLIAKQEKGDSVALLVRRGEGALYVPMPVG